MGFDRDNFVASILPPTGDADDATATIEQESSNETSSQSEPDDQDQVADTGQSDNQTGGQPDTTTSDGPETGSGDEQDDKPQQTVPLSVVVQQRQEIAQLKQNLQQLYQQFEAVNQQKSQQQPEQQPPPDETFKPSVQFEENPERFLLEQNQWLQKQLANVAQHVYGLYQDGMQKEQQQKQQTEAQTKEQQFRSYVQSLEHQYRANNQDYDNAVEYLRNRRIYELENQAKLFNQDPRDPNIGRAIRAEVVKEFSNYARASLQAQRNPAEALYQYAKTIGYQKSAGQSQTDQPSQPEQNPAYERAQRGQQASLSVSSMPGNAPGGAGAETNSQEPQTFGSLAEALKKSVYGK